MKEMDEKIGGNEFDRLRRWYRQGKLSKSRPPNPEHFPKTPTPRKVAQMIKRGRLHNARFHAAVVVRGTKEADSVEIRWDASFPTLYQIRLRGLFVTPIAWATAHLAALFVKHFPRKLAGAHPPELLPVETRRAILSETKSRSIHLSMKAVRRPRADDEDAID
jgi:hypothetical protein